MKNSIVSATNKENTNKVNTMKNSIISNTNTNNTTMKTHKIFGTDYTSLKQSVYDVIRKSDINKIKFSLDDVNTDLKNYDDNNTDMVIDIPVELKVYISDFCRAYDKNALYNITYYTNDILDIDFDADCRGIDYRQFNPSNYYTDILKVNLSDSNYIHKTLITFYHNETDKVRPVYTVIIKQTNVAYYNMLSIKDEIENMDFYEFESMYDNVGLPIGSYAREKYRTMRKNFQIWYGSLTKSNQDKIINYIH